jgi:hypothetical protein
MKSLYRFPFLFTLCDEGFEPYIDKDPDDYDGVIIKPSTPPKIRKKIEKRLKEHKEYLAECERAGIDT